jgi:anaerobic selenocysteine-containing dehydrogenase
MAVHFRTCNLCEAMCGVAVTTENGAITGIRGDAEDALSHGYICPKAAALGDLHDDPDRLRRPLRRRGRDWTEIGWDEAFDEVADRIQRIRRRHGRHAIAVYQGNPTVHNYGSITHGQLFFRSLRTRQHYSATSLDQLPHMLASLMMFGHQVLLPVPDVDRTGLFVIFGANPLASNGSLMTAPGIRARMDGIRARGGRIIVVDPRRTETAAYADRHVFVRPGTDALLLFAIVREILGRRGVRAGHLAAHLTGEEPLRQAAERFTPEAIAGATGVPAAVTRELAETIAAAPRAAVYGRVGVSTQEFGGLSTWLINVLNIVTGNFDREGGVMFTRPAVDLVPLAAHAGLRGSFDRRRTRVRGLPEFGGEFPAAALAEEISEPGAGRIHGLITSAGNPVLSAPNGVRLDRALAGLEFMASIDPYLNETTRHAQIILPPTSALEHDHYGVALHVLAVRNTAKWSPPLFERPADRRHDWEIFAELTARLGGVSRLGRLAARASRPLLLGMTPERILDVALRIGPHRLSLRRLKRSPHGVDLGPLVPCLPERLYTADRRIDLAPAIFVRDVDRLRDRLESAGRRDGTGLVMIGRRDLLSNNSWMHNVPRLMKRANRCTLRMNPADAARLRLADGSRVWVRSAAGSIAADLEISDEMMRGVVSLPHGWGHSRPGVRLRVAGGHAGVSINDVTDEQFVDRLTGGIAFSGLPVEVTPVAAAEVTSERREAYAPAAEQVLADSGPSGQGRGGGRADR